MKTRPRTIIFAVSALVMFVLLVWGVWDLPGFGHYRGPYGIVVQRTTVPERHVTDVVTSVMFDQRGLDTLGEEFILFAAVTGVILLLREYATGGEESQTHEDGKTPAGKTNAVVMLALIAVPIIAYFGTYVTLQAHITVGGGFQGGIVIASAFVLLYLGDQRKTFVHLAPKHIIETAESLGAGAYAIIGLLGLLMGGSFLQNVLPLGKAKNLLSGGTIPLINFFVGIEVAAAFVLLAIEFFKEAEKSERGE